jgi:hypothetical protein
MIALSAIFFLAHAGDDRKGGSSGYTSSPQKDSYNAIMYKILIETETIQNCRQTPFRKIADPHSQLK